MYEFPVLKLYKFNNTREVAMEANLQLWNFHANEPDAGIIKDGANKISPQQVSRRTFKYEKVKQHKRTFIIRMQGPYLSNQNWGNLFSGGTYVRRVVFLKLRHIFFRRRYISKEI